MYSAECGVALKMNEFLIHALLERGYDLFYYDGKIFSEYESGLWRLVPAGKPIIDFAIAATTLEFLLNHVVKMDNVWNKIITPTLAINLNCERSFFSDEEDLQRTIDIGFAYLKGVYIGLDEPKLLYVDDSPGVIVFKGVKHGQAN